MVRFINSRSEVLADQVEGLLNVEVLDSSKDGDMPKARLDKDEIAKLIEEKAKEREVDLFIREILEVEQEMFEIEHPGDSVPGKSAFDKFTSTATVHDKIVERKLLLEMIEEIVGPRGRCPQRHRGDWTTFVHPIYWPRQGKDSRGNREEDSAETNSGGRSSVWVFCHTYGQELALWSRNHIGREEPGTCAHNH